MLADTGRPWQAPAAAKAMAAAGKRGGGPVAPMRRSAAIGEYPAPGARTRDPASRSNRAARIATSGQPRCADKRIPLHDERHRRCVAAFRARLPMPQAISGRHSHAHSRAAARNSVVKMSAPRRRERNIPQRLSSEMPALPSGMPRRSRVPARIRAASIIQQMKRLRALGSCDLHRKFVKKRVSPMTPHSHIHSTARPRNAIGFHPRKTRV
ncbi:hypothetical protein [Burkholderia ubonensis]|uniref:hypothetical protein n=1 Tax=Burkholderia ubonensis TaxID=101571 RepID=UPI0012F867EA|nr:hypothetical protein [Burkholderia ubonensis]